MDFGVIVSPFPSAFFNVGMDICSGSTDLTVPLISLDSQSPALRHNKTRTCVVRPLPGLTMCTSQKSPLFLQLIISSIHTRQRVRGSAPLQRAIYHLSREQEVKNTRRESRAPKAFYEENSSVMNCQTLCDVPVYPSSPDDTALCSQSSCLQN